MPLQVFKIRGFLYQGPDLHTMDLLQYLWSSTTLTVSSSACCLTVSGLLLSDESLLCATLSPSGPCIWLLTAC